MFEVAVLTRQERPQASKEVENPEHIAEQTSALSNVCGRRRFEDASYLNETSLPKGWYAFSLRCHHREVAPHDMRCVRKPDRHPVAGVPEHLPP